MPPPTDFPLRNRAAGHDLGDHPGADGEIGALQAEGEKGSWDGDKQEGNAAPERRIAGIGSIPTQDHTTEQARRQPMPTKAC